MLSTARSEVERVGQNKSVGQSSMPLRPITIQPANFGGKKQISQMKSAAFICAAALVSLVLLPAIFLY